MPGSAIPRRASGLNILQGLYGWHEDLYEYQASFDDQEQTRQDQRQQDRQARDRQRQQDRRARDRQRQQDQRQQARDRQRQQDRQAPDRQRQQDRRQQARTLEGRIAGFRHARFEGVPDRHTLVKVRLQSGRSTVIDLGPKRDLDDLDLRLQDGRAIAVNFGEISLSEVQLEQGDRVMIRGNRSRLDGKTVLVPETFRVTEKTRKSSSASGGSRSAGQ